ncbi:MAG: type II secretion system F family protein [Acidobacteria bacterium]|nr:type II secretion system F family protein [Acidobacteriota bacterium]
MSTFYYRAATATGQWQEGTREGSDEKAVVYQLQTMGLVPVYVGPPPGSSGARVAGDRSPRLPAQQGRLSEAWSLPWGKGRVRAQDRLLFTQELATLLQAGVPLDRALSICMELTESGPLREVLSEVLRQVRAGKPLAEALEARGKVFSRLYVNMVRAGQASGTLSLVFRRLAELESAAAEFRNHLISSLIYPVLLTGVAIASLLILMNFVIPRFAQVFESTGLPVPLPTYLLLEAGKLLRSYGWLALGVLVVGVVWLRRAWNTPAGREWADRFLLRVPLLGELLRKAETARFARTMATLVANGVPLEQSLGIVREIMGNRVMAQSLDEITQGVKRGEGMAGPVRRAGTFPALAAHLLAVGEETGRLDTMFEHLANVYDNETRVAVRRFTSLFEPMVILGMGVVVGVIVLSLLLAITSINEVPF